MRKFIRLLIVLLFLISKAYSQSLKVADLIKLHSATQEQFIKLISKKHFKIITVHTIGFSNYSKDSLSLKESLTYLSLSSPGSHILTYSITSGSFTTNLVPEPYLNHFMEEITHLGFVLKFKDSNAEQDRWNYKNDKYTINVFYTKSNTPSVSIEIHLKN